MGHFRFFTSFIAFLACVLLSGCFSDDAAKENPGGDGEFEAENEVLEETLPFAFTRQDDSEPVTDEEIDSFSQTMRNFYDSTGYFDWLLRMSHGVDASTGKRDYRLWWSDSHALKDGDLVTIVHDYSEEHGGHNILKSNSMILASVLGGYLLTGNATLAKLSELYCKGISSTMLGMVHDEADEILHLMARNVVAFNHEYTTHDGYAKAVDYSNWFFSYDRWNCSRFLYEDNPYWGEVWVTNTRSKDGLGYLLLAASMVRDAMLHGFDETVRDACGETFELLQDFSADIVENAYCIRTKDADGVAYLPGADTGPPEADTGDLASFTAWDLVFPDAECNNKQAVHLLANGEPREIPCTPFGGDPTYEIHSIQHNAPNGHIMRAYHIAAIRWALHHGYDDMAHDSLGGLEERFERDMTIDLSEVNSAPDRWFRDIAINWVQAAGAGYPLTAEEVRDVHEYFTRAAEAFSEFPEWNLWDASVPDGEHDWKPPSSETKEDGEQVHWMGAESMGLLLEYCRSPYKNPDGAKLVDCEILVGIQ